MRRKLKIAVIVDEATTLGLSFDAQLIHLTPRNWLWNINRYKPDFLLVESAWRGHHNRWRRKIVDLDINIHDKSLEKLVSYCKKRSIPTVFWNKEDPIHFDRFSHTAQLFEYIYTTDIHCIPHYLSLNANFKHIDVLMFAAQPQIHHSRKAQKRLANLAFLGGYYGNELKSRSEEQKKILSEIEDQNLIIFDRFWQNETPCSFPLAFRKYCQPGIPAKDIHNLYKQYHLYLNFNTVQSSKTMLSRRVFELAACASPMLSSPSVAIDAIFGSYIPQIHDAKLASVICNEYLKDHELRHQDAINIQQIVLDSHTWQHRLDQIIKTLA
ncbi:glycosyltransferase [uncultured Shewanella sp.]|uniref:CgeB family protein n=1 Tax=uncultured Shewanella sp. TaxID=173975 RepID=UPI002617D372|nr:glycosyltransferase [uncultured Shewanella sp.]